MRLSESNQMCRHLTKALLNCPHIGAAALYGSVARGDAEGYSDIDVLAVCPASHKREAYEEVIFALGSDAARISLALYTPRELLFLAKQRSLFLLHLSNESLILFDHTGLLTQLLATFEPKESYREDFEQSLQLLLPLQKSVVDAPNELHRLAYIYSLFRVFGVYLLSSDGVYEFSKGKMSAALLLKYPHLKCELETLSSLRILNSNFFLGGSCTKTDNCGYDRLKRASGALSSLLGTEILIGQQSFAQAVTAFVEACANGRERLGYKLRTWFLMLLYDGLNLYCGLNDFPAMVDFTEGKLLEFIASDTPLEIRTAASVGLDYLKNYPLRYFLLERSKIPVSQACRALVGIEHCLRAHPVNGQRHVIQLGVPSL